MNATRTLLTEYENAEASIVTLRDAAQQVLPSVSQHDKQLVEDHIGTLEKKLSEGQERAQYHLEGYEETIQHYEDCLQEAESMAKWAELTQAKLTEELPINLTVVQSQEELAQSNALLEQLDSRQVTLETVQRQSHTLSLGSLERDSLDTQIKQLHLTQAGLREAALERRRALTKGISDREVLDRDMERVKSWLDEKSTTVQPLVAVPLKSANIHKATDIHRAVLSEVRMFGPTVARLQEDSLRVSQDKSLRDKLQDIEDRYEGIKSIAQQNIDSLQDTYTSHKQLETDMSKVKKWTEQAKTLCAKPLVLDTSIEQLEESIKKYNNTAKNGSPHRSTLNELSARQENVKSELSDADMMSLKEEVSELNETFERLWEEVTSRLSSLEETVENRRKFDKDIADLGRLVHQSQGEMKKFNRGVTPKQADLKQAITTAEKIQDELADFQPRVNALRQTCDQLRVLGQSGPSEELLRLGAQHEELLEQVALLQSQLHRASALVETYDSERKEMLTCLERMEAEVETAEMRGVSVGDKIEKFKVIVDTLKSKDVNLATLEDKGKQLAIECIPTQAKSLNEQVNSICSRARKLRAETERKLKVLQKVTEERCQFDTELAKCTTWLRGKVPVATTGTHNQLSIDTEGVDAELEKLKALKQEVETKITAMSSAVESTELQYQHLSEELPVETQNRIKEFTEEKQHTQKQLADRETYLTLAKAQREELHDVTEAVQRWVDSAENHLKAGLEGVNHPTLQLQLAQQQDLCSGVATVDKQMDHLLDLCETISPSLDINDSTTLKQSVTNLGSKVNKVSSDAEVKLKELKDANKEYQQYQDELTSLDHTLTDLETTWSTTPQLEYTSVEQARDHLLTTQEFQHGLSRHQPHITKLGERARSLQSKADPASKATVGEQTNTLEKRWAKLNADSGQQMGQLKEVVESWEIYEEKLGSMKDLLDSTRASLADEGYDTLSTSQLEELLNKSQTTLLQMQDNRKELSIIQKSAQEVLTQLPAGGVKTRLQKQLISVQDSFEQLEWNSREKQQAIETEINDREEFVSDLATLKQALSEVKVTLEQNKEGETEGVNQTVKEDIELKTAELARLLRDHRDRYSTGRLPPELEEEAETTTELSEQVVALLREQDAQVIQARKSRGLAYTSARQLSDWLAQAEERMSVKPQDVREAQEQHQRLVAEISQIVPQVEQLKYHLQDAAGSMSPEEKVELEGKVKDMEGRLKGLQASATVRSQDLDEAVALWQTLETGAQEVEEWTEHAHSVIKSPLVWDSLETAEQQVNSHHVLTSEAESQEVKLAELEATVARLEALGMDSSKARARLQALRESYKATQRENTQRVGELEQALGEWKECKAEMDSITKWAEETRAALQTRDDTQSLQEQLQQQEQCIKEIEREDRRIRSLTARQVALTGGQDMAPSLGEIEELKHRAVVRKEEIRQALHQQQSHQAEVERLNSVVKQSRASLGRPALAGESVQELRRQIASQNVLATEVHRWQHRVDEINALSTSLLEETHQKGLVVPPRQVGEISDTESEQGMRMAQSSLSTESSHHLDMKEEEPIQAGSDLSQMIDGSEEISTESMHHLDMKGEEPIHADPSQMIDGSKENAGCQGNDASDYDVAPPAEEQGDQKMAEGPMEFEKELLQGGGQTEVKPNVKVILFPEQMEGLIETEGDVMVEGSNSEKQPDNVGIQSEAELERPASRLSTHSDDTDALMNECEETLHQSSKDPDDELPDKQDSDSASRCSENSTMALMNLLDEALNTDQAAMSFDSLASSSSTATLDGQVVENPNKHTAEWTGVPVLTSTGSLESSEVFNWQPPSTEELSDQIELNNYGRAVVGNMQPISESADTLNTSLSLSLAATETESNSSLSESHLVYGHTSRGWADVTAGTVSMEYEYIDRLATPRTPRDEHDHQYTGPNTPRALSVLSPRSGDQSFGSEFVAIPYYIPEDGVSTDPPSSPSAIPLGEKLHATAIASTHPLSSPSPISLSEKLHAAAVKYSCSSADNSPRPMTDSSDLKSDQLTDRSVTTTTDSPLVKSDDTSQLISDIPTDSDQSDHVTDPENHSDPHDVKEEQVEFEETTEYLEQHGELSQQRKLFGDSREKVGDADSSMDKPQNEGEDGKYEEPKQNKLKDSEECQENAADSISALQHDEQITSPIVLVEMPLKRPNDSTVTMEMRASSAEELKLTETGPDTSETMETQTLKRTSEPEKPAEESSIQDNTFKQADTQDFENVPTDDSHLLNVELEKATHQDSEDCDNGQFDDEEQEIQDASTLSESSVKGNSSDSTPVLHAEINYDEAGSKESSGIDHESEEDVGTDQSSHVLPILTTESSSVDDVTTKKVMPSDKSEPDLPITMPRTNEPSHVTIADNQSHMTKEFGQVREQAESRDSQGMLVNPDVDSATTSLEGQRLSKSVTSLTQELDITTKTTENAVDVSQIAIAPKSGMLGNDDEEDKLESNIFAESHDSAIQSASSFTDSQYQPSETNDVQEDGSSVDPPFYTQTAAVSRYSVRSLPQNTDRDNHLTKPIVEKPGSHFQSSTHSTKPVLKKQETDQTDVDKDGHSHEQANSESVSHNLDSAHSIIGSTLPSDVQSVEAHSVTSTSATSQVILNPQTLPPLDSSVQTQSTFDLLTLKDLTLSQQDGTQVVKPKVPQTHRQLPDLASSPPQGSQPLTQSHSSPAQGSQPLTQSMSSSAGSPGSGLSLADLNTSWQSHQSSSQQSSRETAEVLASQQQEAFQVGVRNLQNKHGKVRETLSALSPTNVHTLRSQQVNAGDVLVDLDLIESDLERVRGLAASISQKSGDSGVRETMATTLRVLTEQHEALKQEAQDKHRMVHRAVEERSGHQAALQQYNDKVKDYEAWLTQARVDTAAEPSITHDVAYLKEQLRENQKLQSEMTLRLAQLDDMSVECERLCDQETPAKSHDLRTQLASLREDTEQLKLDAYRKQDLLKEALKGSKKRREDLDSYRKSVENLQKWIEETKKLAEGSPRLDDSGRETEEKLRQGLKSDVAEGQALIDSLSGQARGAMRSARSESSEELDSDDSATASWRRLQRQLSDKNRLLQESMESLGSAQFVATPMYRYAHQSPQPESVTSHIHEVRQSLSQLKACWDRLQGQMDDKDVRLTQALEFQNLYQVALQNISAWLDEVELKLFSTGYEEDADRHMENHRSLQDEICALQGEIAHMNKASQELMSESGAESRGLIRQAVENLNERLRLLESQARDKEDSLRQQGTVRQDLRQQALLLSKHIAETKQKYDNLSESEFQLENKMSDCRRLEAKVKEYEPKVTALVSHNESTGATNPRHVSPPEISQLQSQWLQLKHTSSSVKAALERGLSTARQYERMLDEYAEFLETAQGKLRNEAVAAMDRGHLVHQVKAHKEFFTDLESHRAMLDALSQQVDQPTRQKYQPSHTRLNNLTHLVQDKAAIQGQKLERLARDWDDFDAHFQDTRAYIRRLKQMSPKTGVEHESVEALRKRVWDYNTLERSLNEEKASVLQSLDRGRHLLQAVSCPALESEVTECTESWVKLNNDTRTQLKKLQNLVDQMERFERDASTLETWLATAKNRLKILSSLEDPELQSLGAMKHKMELFLDFRKEIEGKKPLKMEVVTLGNQLLRSRPREIGIQGRLEQIEEDWLGLMYQLPDNEEHLHMAQMELLPSRQALNELLMWLDKAEGSVKEEEQPGSLVDVQVALRRLKDLKIDLTNKQLTVDFVNQSAADPHLRESSDKNDFSEKLGEMNHRYTRVSGLVVERLKSLEMLLLRWEDYDRAVKSLDNWFIDQEGKLGRFERLGHLISVQQSLRECKEMQSHLRKKENEIDQINKKGQALIDPKKSSLLTSRPIVMKTDKLNQKWAGLERQLMSVQDSLEHAQLEWESYHQALGKVSRLLTQTEYALNRHRVASGDLQSFNMTIQQIQAVSLEFHHGKVHLDDLLTCGKNLNAVVDSLVSQHVDRTLKQCCHQWQEVETLGRERLVRFESVRRDWEAYEEEFTGCKAWIEAKETEVNELLRNSAQDPRAVLKQAQTLQSDLSTFRDTLLQLGRRSDQLTPHIDNATVIHITSRESALSQRLQNLQNALARHNHSTQTEAKRHSKFEDAYDIVNAFLLEADSTLGVADPDKSSHEGEIRSRLGELKDLTKSFRRRQGALELLNEMGFRLPLSGSNSQRLRDLNHRWQQLSYDGLERYKSLQGELLVSEDFNAKCDEWSAFLSQVERDLVTDIAGNLDALLVQQQIYETFQNELYSRQQVLASIVDEGHQMIQYGEIEDAAEFQHKLGQLEDQWHSVVKRANQRKALVDGRVAQWQAYKSDLERLTVSLEDMTRGLDSLKVENAPVQKLRHLMDHIQTKESDLQSQEPLYQQVTELSRNVKAHADPTAVQEVTSELQGVQDKWVFLLKTLGQRHKELEEIVAQWHLLETGVEDNMDYLREVRHQLTGTLPDMYEDLQKHSQQCKELQSKLGGGRDKVASLEADKRALATHIATEDLVVLQQRLTLLGKQWAEMENQVVLRQQEVNDKLHSWAEFNDKYRDLMERLSVLEERISSNAELQIEDLLNKLEQDYHEQLVQIAGEKEVLHSRGQRLMRASSDIRATDIEQKLARLADRWQHLQELTATRKRKLRETVNAVQQLERSMSKLREWLAHMEHELSAPIGYNSPDLADIQRHLQAVQAIQNDTEKQSAGVTSVLNLCDVLLGDRDACPTTTERRAIQQARDSLDKRWKNICALATERKMTIEETWHQWQNWTDSCRKFDDWLVPAERRAKFPKMDGSFVVVRQEIRTFEAFKNEIHNRLSELEVLNRDYRRLAREGRTDTLGQIKERTQDLNRRWDELSRRTSAIVRRLRHVMNVKEDFDATRKALIAWLSDLDLRLTNLEFLKDAPVALRLKNVKGMKEEMTQNGHRLQYIDRAGAYLIQKSEPGDAAHVQKDLDHFQKVLEKVLAHLNGVHAKLTQKATGQDEAAALLYEDAPSSPLSSSPSSSEEDSEYFTAPVRTPHIPVNLNEVLHAEALHHRGTPPGLTQLDWDESSVDFSSGSESGESDPGLLLRESPDGQERWRAYVEQMGNRQEKLARIEALLAQLNGHVTRAREAIVAAERQLRAMTPTGPEVERAPGGYTKLVAPCQAAVAALSDLERRLQQETGVTSPDPHIQALRERCKNLQAEAAHKEQRLAHNKAQWRCFKTDMVGLTQWLGEAETIQATQVNTPSEISQLQTAVRRHKEFLTQIDGKKPVVLSINLVSKDSPLSTSSIHRDSPGIYTQVAALNARWDKVCARAAVWQKELQIALCQSGEFANALRDINGWLRQMERSVREQEPVDFTASRAVQVDKYNKFRSLRLDLEAGRSRVQSLQDTTDQLLDGTDDDTLALQSRVSSSNAHLNSLLKICTTYMDRLENVADLTHLLQPSTSSLYDSPDGLTSARSATYLTATSPARSRTRPLYTPWTLTRRW